MQLLLQLLLLWPVVKTHLLCVVKDIALVYAFIRDLFTNVLSYCLFGT